ncbi:S-adenosylmethionine:tRNA ribosyltransferase-isomerase [Streptomyces sp. NBC_01433]|uniref:S-adenosylmethionine:tRNA ribosyltransferase-isomerase n=1 Tax=Streptomyces sp. NBC_01433 TaxID=2903864 RepID=UPI00224FA25B|nr:S-adenosylmethionine:tRNA ribosyltransferase-isomerase [Streptomyces sp. NBC_01433]MCX4681187.1 S-adenosylmethionine:tRNA ribosyltransferase-isomerase [Streptomyces sp. NBC_01433]
MDRTVEDPRDYRFDLPEDLLVQEPPEALGGERSDARLAVLGRHTGQVEHRRFGEIVEYLGADDVLVLNNARVVPTFLDGEHEHGRTVVVSVHSPRDDGTWHCHIAPAAACRPGARFRIGPHHEVTCSLIAETVPGLWHIALDPSDPDTLYRLAEPAYSRYLKQPPADPESFQNVYASRPGAVGFPAAGRHFTPVLLDRLRSRGTAVAEVTLFLATRTHYDVRHRFRDLIDAGGTGDLEAENEFDVSPATDTFDFPPPERFEITTQAADTINERRARGGRIIVCGTSVMRTLETAADPDGRLPATTGFTRLRITPGHRFRACDAFMTNFHDPCTSELVLTAAFTGREHLMNAYRHEVIPRRYRFNYYGDSMLII